MNFKDLTGQKFGKLTVIKQIENHESKNGNSRIQWLCKCDCGNETAVMGLNLTRGHTTSCGCARKDRRKKLQVDITGQRFGKLVAVKHIDNNKKGTYWLFKCDCGNEKEILLQNVKSGKTKSCGECNKSTKSQNSIIGKNSNLIGQKFDKLTPIKRIEENNAIKYLCKCDCGNECIKTASSLLYGTKQRGTNSCGCLHKKSIKKTPSLINQKFNFLTVIAAADSKYGKLHWRCRCDCGKETIVSSSGLLSGHTKSCGCYQDTKASEIHFEDLTGQKFGMLTVLKRVENDKMGQVQFLCKCDCGNEKVIRSSHLKRGAILSCGCSVQSFGEQFINNALKKMNVFYDTQVKFKDLTGVGGKELSYDFGIYTDDKLQELIVLIEYQGKQHYEPLDYFGGETQFEKQQLHDELKKEYAKDFLGVPLLEIPYIIHTENEIYELIAQYIKK